MNKTTTTFQPYKSLSPIEEMKPKWNLLFYAVALTASSTLNAFPQPARHNNEDTSWENYIELITVKWLENA